MNEIFEKLRAPFAANEIDWRIGHVSETNEKALALAYLTSRAVMTRLDMVVGPQNWRDSYRPGPIGGVLCQLSIRVEDEWLAKEDGAGESEIEGIKGAYSDSYKRAAVKFGVGRYLYDLPKIWHPVEKKGRSWVLKGTPTLAANFLPVPLTVERNPASVKKDPPPPKNNKATERPYPPERVREGLQKKRDEKPHFSYRDGKRAGAQGILVNAMNQLFAGDETHRRAVMAFLWEKVSTNDLTDQEIRVMLNTWLDVSKSDVGDWAWNGLSEREAHAIVRVQKISDGQLEMEMS